MAKYYAGLRITIACIILVGSTICAMRGHTQLSVSGMTLGQWYLFSFLPGGHIDMQLQISGTPFSNVSNVWSLACTTDEVRSLAQKSNMCGDDAADLSMQW